jgi:UDP-2,4-diacetamido-2,4,6-trideoxy-beta-L-altropyranose hydrolase
MNIVEFRADASLQIGTGHVMRCLSLADALRNAGARCRFISREHPGNLLGVIRQRGYEAVALPEVGQSLFHGAFASEEDHLVHAAWLGVEWREDVAQTQSVLSRASKTWLVVDHYALDARWETALKPYYDKLLVIDDLADRPHTCDLLLDQNLVEGMETRYEGMLPRYCKRLIGPRFSLLRAEFGQWRPSSLSRRKAPVLERLLIFMGGSDPENDTGKVVAGCKLAKRRWKHIDVVVGKSFPALAELQDSLRDLPEACLHVQTNRMAELMRDADLAVTTGGSVTWEKCALGLPSLVAIQAENQRSIALKMHELGAQRNIGLTKDLDAAAYARQLDAFSPESLAELTSQASSICDGSGAKRVAEIMGKLS